LLVERHRVERPLPTEQEMAARRKTREGGILDERSYPTVREIDHAHVVSRVGVRDVQKSGAAAREETGPAVIFLPWPIRSCHPTYGPTDIRDPGDSAAAAPEEDRPILTPASAAQSCRIGKGQDRAAVDRNLLQLVEGPESDGTAVRREEGTDRAFRPRERPRVHFGSITEIELAGHILAADDRDPFAVRRDGH